MIHRDPDDQGPAVPIRPARRRIWTRVLVVVLVVAAMTLRGAAVLWTDFLWFSSVDRSSVWRTILFNRIGLVVVAGILAVAFIAINLFLAERLSPRLTVASVEGARDEMVERFQMLAEAYATRIYVGVALFFGLLMGLGASGLWQDFLLFQNSQSFGVPDPVFANDIGFYVFRLPFWRDLFQFGFQLVVWTTFLTAALHYLNGGIVVQQDVRRISSGVKVHLSVLLAIVALLKAWGYRLDQYDLLFSNRGAVLGATYTDVNAQLPALRLMVWVAIIVGILLLINIRIKGWSLPVVAGGLWLAASVLVATLYPTLIQRFSVEPKELSQEAEFIERHITSTRDAYGLSDVTARGFAASPDLDDEDIANNSLTVDNLRLWDPGVLKEAYVQLQELRTYYQVDDVDTDRYVIDGKLTQVMLSARELAPALDPAESNWTNDHLIFTHGFGVVASPANDVSVEGQPQFLVGDIPLNVTAEELTLTQERIYFGEVAAEGSFVIVGTKEREVDSLTADANDLTFNSYDGTGGVQVGGLIRRAAFALRFGDTNTVLSGLITPDSRVLMVRNIQDRLEKVAPFLAQDSDPYLVIVDGEMRWIVDMYSTSTRYPYSQRANTSRLAATAHPSALPNNFNYVRNSVKAVIDPFNGDMSLYIVDQDDPIIRAYASIFPDLFASIDAMPDEIKQHFRYPEDLFRVQSDMYGRYHVTAPSVFFSESDQWEIDEDPSKGVTRPSLRGAASPPPMLPYYLLMRLPEDENPTFLIMQPFTPEGRPNMVSFLIAKSEPESYGEMIDFRFRAGDPPAGPNQVAARINSDTIVSDITTQLDQQGSDVIFGNLLVIPIEESIVYMQPLYTIAENQTNAIPELKKVVMVFNDRVIIRDTLAQAVEATFGFVAAGPDPGPTPETPPAGSGTAEDLLESARVAFEEAEAALREGDLAQYQQLIGEAQILVNQAISLLNTG